jgi:hypothetical protein
VLRQDALSANRIGPPMSDASEANKDRNRAIAQNEEAKQVTGSARVSMAAMAAFVVAGGILFTLGWIALR